MTKERSFKQLVRARMAKTGESYTAARAVLLQAAPPPAGADEPVLVTSDAEIRRRTGRGWEAWFDLLDERHADALEHRAISRLVAEELGIGPLVWEAQAITLSYERARGRRAVGQHPNGFTVTASRTVAAPAERVFDAFADGSQWATWLPDGELSERTATRPRSIRFDWGDGTTRVNVYIQAQGRRQGHRDRRARPPRRPTGRRQDEGLLARSPPRPAAPPRGGPAVAQDPAWVGLAYTLGGYKVVGMSALHDLHQHVPEGHATHDGHAGHDAHAGHDPEMFRRRFWVSLLLTIPLVVTSEMVMDWFGYRIDVPGMSWFGPVIGSIVFWWGGWPFLTGGVAELRARQPGMMLLISMAIVVAYGASMATSLGWLDLEFWWELAALVTIMLLGHWQEMKAIGQARGALAALAELLPDEAEVVDGDDVQTVPVGALRVGNVVLVRAGGRVPADGGIVEGEAAIDESMITGESRPVVKGPGDRVVAGTVSTDSSVRVRVEAVGDATTLAGIQRLVADAQQSRSRAQALADRFAALLFYVATVTAVITFAAWTLAGDVDDAVVRTVTVLVIACPHALGLAIPLVIALSTAVAARAGILIKDRLALERMRTVDTVLFDKTGTLTKGRHVVRGVASREDLGDDEARRRGGRCGSRQRAPVGPRHRGRRAGPSPEGERLPRPDRSGRRGRRGGDVVRGRRSGPVARAPPGGARHARGGDGRVAGARRGRAVPRPRRRGGRGVRPRGRGAPGSAGGRRGPSPPGHRRRDGHR